MSRYITIYKSQSFLMVLFVLLMVSCKQQFEGTSEATTPVSILSDPCDKFIGKFTRTATFSMFGSTGSSTSNIEITKDGKAYRIVIGMDVDNSNYDAKTKELVNNMFKHSMPDYLQCNCNEKGNLIPADAGQKFEYALDKNNDLYAGGYVFKRVDAFASKATPKALEQTQETQTENATVYEQDGMRSSSDPDAIKLTDKTKSDLKQMIEDANLPTDVKDLPKGN